MKRTGSALRIRAFATIALLACTNTAAPRVPRPLGGAPGKPEIGIAPNGFEPALACRNWLDATLGQPRARNHHVRAEHSASACYVPVHYRDGALDHWDAPAANCGYPGELDTTRATLNESAAALSDSRQPLPVALACALPSDVRQEILEHNARTLRSLATRLTSPRAYPYAAVFAFGLGSPDHDEIPIADWRPSLGCGLALDAESLRLFGLNRIRTYRAVEAVERGVAPVVIFSGGAVHSTRYEVFLMSYLAQCRFGLPPDRILFDPCARHTHENLRNAGGLLRSLAGRTAYIVTDSGLQALYLSDSEIFDWIGGSLDQRSLRDFGYLVGAWERASVGMPAGFWYTPFRFWASPEPEIASLSCAR